MGPYGDFDTKAFHGELDAQRQARDLTWAELARELSGPRREGFHPMSPSTLAGMADKKGILSPNNVMAALRWLGRTPESFMAGHPDASVGARFSADAELTTFWDFDALRTAVETRRVQLDMTPAQAAADIGVPVATVRTLLKGGGAGFPRIMRFTTWLDQPATEFLHSRRSFTERMQSRLKAATEAEPTQAAREAPDTR